ncbi:hypothetical protein ABM000_19710 [Morganella morganii]|uniref:hypothetical protein n=1 Tax=Morganella morganii TaxID=582 RepID=UPI002958FF48|nr:hypothetical protein [Morganella morganii]
MAEWKGVPYLFDVTDGLSDKLSVLVESIPRVIVETPFSWETVLGSLLAAALPSLIAWKALSENRKLIEYQNTLSNSREMINLLRITTAVYLSKIEHIAQSLEKYSLMISNGDGVNKDKIVYSINDDIKGVNLESKKLSLLLNENVGLQKEFLEKIVKLDSDINNLQIISINGSIDVPIEKDNIIKSIDILIRDMRIILFNIEKQY